jgi:hypothetical protein
VPPVAEVPVELKYLDVCSKVAEICAKAMETSRYLIAAARQWEIPGRNSSGQLDHVCVLLHYPVQVLSGGIETR